MNEEFDYEEMSQGKVFFIALGAMFIVFGGNTVRLSSN